MYDTLDLGLMVFLGIVSAMMVEKISYHSSQKEFTYVVCRVHGYGKALKHIGIEVGLLIHSKGGRLMHGECCVQFKTYM